ncbi:hypothetical protein E5344_11005 [Microbacterium laevaniformans]|uniref:Uncharacterized protein n=1 Tax=Microbacterium laevaniformans TaxID=36807 RepID=A0A4V3RJK2_9MICO|nr:hypothetical protein [Microbacterium laevaniformans]TGY36290.1 hypothetical protein E5344_11005 [Microbacterium laevaniformans]
MTEFETHEPDFPFNWPEGHVFVERSTRNAQQIEPVRVSAVDVEITDDDEDECIMVSIARHRHFLHSTTARALSDMLVANDGSAVEVTVHSVRHLLGEKTARALRQLLQRRLREWNADFAGPAGLPGV